MITKQTLRTAINVALRNAGLNPSDFPNLPLRVLQSGAIKLDNVAPPKADAGYLEMVILGGSSNQGIRTSGNHVNVFALAAVVLSATSAQPTLPSFLGLLVALLGACTVNLSPEQSAFFLAVKALEKQSTIPTASALAVSMGGFLNQPSYTTAALLSVVSQLQSMGVQISVGEPPNQVIRHTEVSLSFPGS
ncbi:hypothetical protein [Oxalicibacterium faecigallinarum]|uniref:hypothetical protein n=1 Tax=Oxalicibacterium faecigallinarum TaxID=573741 RepID=UPI001E542EE9|nr:hypothetical protein [Oxalicibacterium faecigallinarum]